MKTLKIRIPKSIVSEDRDCPDHVTLSVHGEEKAKEIRKWLNEVFKEFLK